MSFSFCFKFLGQAYAHTDNYSNIERFDKQSYRKNKMVQFFAWQCTGTPDPLAGTEGGTSRRREEKEKGGRKRKEGKDMKEW